MTYSKKNKAKFIELKNIVDLSDEEGIKLEDEFEKIDANKDGFISRREWNKYVKKGKKHAKSGKKTVVPKEKSK